MAHIHKRIRHHLTKHRTKFTTFASLLFIAVFLSGIFLLTRGNNPSVSELAFTEYSNVSQISGSVIPASCVSGGYNGDGSYDGCPTQVCGDGSVITPAAGQTCPVDTCAAAVASNYCTTDCCTTFSGTQRCGTQNCQQTCTDPQASNYGAIGQCSYTTTNVCPTGYTGTYPNCVAPSNGGGPTGTCPAGYTGTYPNCIAPLPSGCGTGTLNDTCPSGPPSGCGAGTLNDTCGLPSGCGTGTLNDQCGAPSICQDANADNFGGVAPCKYSCDNGAMNYPSCTSCGAGWVMLNGMCRAFGPDLTAGSVSPTSVLVNTPSTYSALISNIGTLTTTVGFYNFIQVASGDLGSGTITDLPRVAMTALTGIGTASSTATTSQSYTFTTAGTHSVRACADKSSSGDAGMIHEKNEANNCGAWTTVTVVDPNANKPAVVDPIIDGNNTPNGDISFSCVNSDHYTVTQTEGTDSNFPMAAFYYGQSVNIPVTVAGNYSIICTELGSPSSPVVLNYNPVPPAASALSLTATPRSISSNTKVTLQWGITNPNSSCRIVVTPICTDTCDATHTNAAAALQSTLDTGSTDSNDPYGASRSMTSALQTPYVSGGSRGAGKKTLQIQYTTDFKLQCGANAASTTIRVLVTNANEG
jgi:hypothetical protein